MEQGYSHRFINFLKIVTLFIFMVFGNGFTKGDTDAFRLIVFEGSDWCPNCRRLEKNILSDSLFLHRMASASISLERIDFPQRKKLPAEVVERNQKIAGDFVFDGQFPTLILSRSDTMIFRKILYSNQSPDELASLILKTSELLK